MTIERHGIGPRMSQAVVAGGLVFLAGQVAEKNAGKDVGKQTKEVLGEIDKLLKKAGTSKSKLVSATVYLSSIGDFDAMNAVYDAWVDKANPPARACVEARLAGTEFNVEIVAVAAL